MDKKYQLPKEFSTKWVEALRSGEFKQGDFGLFYNDTFCCLGVGCIVAGATREEIEGKGTAIENLINSNITFTISDKAFFASIPKALKGAASTNPLVGELVGLNDDEGLSFPEIADWIEENVEFVESVGTHE